MVSLFKTKWTVVNQLELSMIGIYSYSSEQLLLIDNSQEQMSVSKLHSLGPVWETYKKNEKAEHKICTFLNKKGFSCFEVYSTDLQVVPVS